MARLFGFVDRLLGKSDTSPKQADSAPPSIAPAAERPPVALAQINCGYLQLLCDYLKPNKVSVQPGEYWYDVWLEVTGEPYTQALTRMIDAGLLRPLTLEERMEDAKVTDLRPLMQERQIAPCRKKSDMIARLIDADPETMVRLYPDNGRLICTEDGRTKAEAYRTDRERKRQETNHQAMEAMDRGDFEAAVRLVGDYRNSQVYGRGLSVGGSTPYSGTYEVERLSRIFQAKPAILASIADDGQLRQLRLVAGMMLLWGRAHNDKWQPLDFETGLHFDNVVAARMLMFSATKQHELAEWRRTGLVRRIEVMPANDACPECKKLSGKSFRLGSVPELPHLRCTSEMGCRCTYIPVIDR